MPNLIPLQSDCMVWYASIYGSSDVIVAQVHGVHIELKAGGRMKYAGKIVPDSFTRMQMKKLEASSF